MSPKGELLNHTKGNRNDLRYGLINTLKEIKPGGRKGWICT